AHGVLVPGAAARFVMRPQRVQQRSQPALHVVDARAPGAALVVDTKWTLFGRTRREDGVVVADEEEALEPGARLVAHQVVAEAIVDDAAGGEAQGLRARHPAWAPPRCAEV